MALDPQKFTIPKSYLAYLQLCDRREIRPLDETSFKAAIEDFLNQLEQEPNTDKAVQTIALMAKLGLAADSQTGTQNDIDAESVESTGDAGAGSGESSQLSEMDLGTAGGSISKTVTDPSVPANAAHRDICASPIKINLEYGKIEGLGPDRKLEAVGRLPSDLVPAGNFFVVHRGSEHILDDFRVDIGDGDKMISYPGKPTRTSSGELSVKTVGIGTFIFPKAEGPDGAEGIFIDGITSLKSDMKKVIRPRGTNPEDQWVHLGQMLLEIELN